MKPLSAALFLLLATLCGCPEPSNRTSAGGCTKDSDCKGDRVCVSGECQAASPDQHRHRRHGPPDAPQPTPASNPNPGADDSEYVVAVPPPHRNGVVKTDPSFAAGQVTQIPSGTHVRVTGRSADGAWMSVRFPYPDGNQQGWMHRDILVRPGAAPAAAPQPAAQPAAQKSDGVDCRTVDTSLPCVLKDRRIGVCRQHRCTDVCPPGFSFSATDTQCHRPCGLGCNKCGYESLCDDAAATRPAR